MLTYGGGGSNEFGTVFLIKNRWFLHLMLLASSQQQTSKSIAISYLDKHHETRDLVRESNRCAAE